ncbi:hypothetical protein BH20ACI4_BH20ACI4_05940 [soil metagenome]
MNIQKIKQLCVLLIASLIFAVGTVPANAKRNVEKSNEMRADTIVIRCPEFIKTSIQKEDGQGDWVLTSGSLRVKWSRLRIIPTYSGNPGSILCYYEVAKGTELNIYQYIANNYTCTQLPDPRAVECKSRPPIKIGGNKGD